jgi:hypothetical protein
VDDGLVDAAAAMAGRVSIEHLSRSNHVGVLAIDGEPLVALKHHTATSAALGGGAAEVAAYRWLARAPETAELAPRLLLVAEECIILEVIVHARPLHDALANSGPDADRLLAILGGRLGALHRAKPDGNALQRPCPWVFDVADGTVPDIFATDAAVESLAAEVAADPLLHAVLEEFRCAWRPVTPVHGDVKFDNVLVQSVPGEPSAAVIRIIDWELAGLGQPAWDLAGILDGLVVPALQTDPPDIALAQMERAVPAIDAHKGAVGAALAPDDRSLLVATTARLVQSAIQLCAMRHGTPACAGASRRVLDGAKTLARQLRRESGSAACVA